MRVQKLLLTNFVIWGIATPAWGRGPADPDAPVPPARYAPVMSGTKSFRPVQPEPWGDVNRSVAPPEGKKPPVSKEKGPGPGQRDPH
jgi:hypothetical protein